MRTRILKWEREHKNTEMKTLKWERKHKNTKVRTLKWEREHKTRKWKIMKLVNAHVRHAWNIWKFLLCNWGLWEFTSCKLLYKSIESQTKVNDSTGNLIAPYWDMTKRSFESVESRINVWKPSLLSTQNVFVPVFPLHNFFISKANFNDSINVTALNPCSCWNKKPCRHNR